MTTKFKGFKSISELKYEQKVFQCDKCGNVCEVTEIKTPEGVLYHGDTCERYSGMHKEKLIKENLFKEREKILMSYHKRNNGKKIGLARTGMFNEIAPFFFAFFNEIGFDAVISRKTDKAIMSQGVERATADAFCFPMKVAFGHYHELEEKARNKEIDYIFVPNIIEAYRSKFFDVDEITNLEIIEETGWDRSQTCPFLQNFNALITKNFPAEKIISSYLSFREGNLVKALTDSMNGSSEKQVARAVEFGKEAYFDFKKKISEIGKDVLENLDKKAIVLVGRPYATFDEAINLRVVKKVLDQGFQIIPQDFLPLANEDLSKEWPNEFSIQGQLTLNAANVIRKNPNLEAVFLDYYSCGPNSFIKNFFFEEIGGTEKPYLTLQIDEHTADAGLVTRLEAFLDSIK